VSEDNQDVKSYLDDLKSTRNSPLELREETNRIIEVNEDSSSSETSSK